MEQVKNQDVMTGSLASEAKGNNKGLIVGMVVCAVVAVGGAAFGVYGMMQSSQKDGQISDLRVQIKENDGTVTTIETPEIETTTKDGTTITIADSAVSYAYSEKYLYIPEMGIKVNLGDELKNVSAYIRHSDGRTSIWGTKGDDEHFRVAANMDFADAMTNPVGIGHLAIFKKGSSDIMAQWQKVYEYDDYEIYYWCSSVSENMPGDKTDIQEAFEAINAVFGDTNNYSRM